MGKPKIPIGISKVRATPFEMLIKKIWVAYCLKRYIVLLKTLFLSLI